jgi:UDP-N-acetylglucosamine/UDP-N-acetylgalactosamine diphosphorylase
LAKKKIKFFDEAKGESVTPGNINGYKFELFYFDVLPMSDPEKFGLIEVKREEEFAPVKNAPGSSQDSPDTARSLISNLHQGWLEHKGSKFDKKAGSEKDVLFELDIKTIYDARDPNLEKYLNQVKGQEIKLPSYITLSNH